MFYAYFMDHPFLDTPALTNYTDLSEHDIFGRNKDATHVNGLKLALDVHEERHIAQSEMDSTQTFPAN
jgi:hypothetical protein